MNSETRKAISLAKINIMTRPQTAFLATVCANLPVYIDNSTSTGATDGKVIKLNEDFFMSLDKEERSFLLAHETLHVVYMHALRREYRNPIRFNYAADYVINWQLQKQGFKLIDGVLINSDYADMTTEQVYKVLQDNEDDSVNGNPLDEDINYQDGLSDSDYKELEADIRDIIIKSAQIATMQGEDDSIPNSIKRYLQELAKPKVNWKVVLRRFMQSLNDHDYTWRKPRKRYMPHDLYMPSMCCEGLSKITFAIDTSGSITDAQFNQFISEIHAVMRHLKPKVIEVIQFDHELQAHDTIKSLTDLVNIKCKGYGGTVPDVALEHFNKTDSTALIIITDGYFNKPKVKVIKPVIWCVFDNRDFQAPFGKCIYLD